MSLEENIERLADALEKIANKDDTIIKQAIRAMSIKPPKSDAPKGKQQGAAEVRAHRRRELPQLNILASGAVIPERRKAIRRKN